MPMPIPTLAQILLTQYIPFSERIAHENAVNPPTQDARNPSVQANLSLLFFGSRFARSRTLSHITKRVTV